MNEDDAARTAFHDGGAGIESTSSTTPVETATEAVMFCFSFPFGLAIWKRAVNDLIGIDCAYDLIESP